jgi:hypothetical protein
MCLIKDAFVGEKNFIVIKMHGTTIQIMRKCIISYQEVLRSVLKNVKH